MILIICATFALLIHLIHYLRNRELYRVNLPGPRPWPFIGNAVSLLISGWKDHLSVVPHLTEKWETPLRVWVGPELAVIVTKPEDVEVVLNSPQCINRAKLYNLTSTFLGPTILTMKGKEWKERRRILSPCYSTMILRDAVPTFNEVVHTMVQRLRMEAEKGQQLDIYHFIEECTYDMVLHTSLKTETNIQKSQQPELVEIAKRSTKNWKRRILLYPISQIDALYKLTAVGREDKRNHERLLAKTNELIEQGREKLEETQFKDGFRSPEVFINHMWKLKDIHMNDTDIRRECMVMIGASSETISLAMSHSVLLLAMYPEYQKRVLKEVKPVIPHRNSAQIITYADLSKLTVLDLVIKESLRLFPPGHLMARETSSPLELNGVKIPTGTNVVVPVLNIHRDEKLWGPTAKEFDPNRFLPENCEKRHPYSYIPFSAGPRNCLGQKQAMASMKIGIGHLVRNFQFSTELKLEKLRLDGDFVLKLFNKQMVKVAERDD